MLIEGDVLLDFLSLQNFRLDDQSKVLCVRITVCYLLRNHDNESDCLNAYFYLTSAVDAYWRILAQPRQLGSTNKTFSSRFILFYEKLVYSRTIWHQHLVDSIRPRAKEKVWRKVDNLQHQCLKLHRSML